MLLSDAGVQSRTLPQRRGASANEPHAQVGGCMHHHDTGNNKPGPLLSDVFIVFYYYFLVLTISAHELSFLIIFLNDRGTLMKLIAIVFSYWIMNFLSIFYVLFIIISRNYYCDTNIITIFTMGYLWNRCCTNQENLYISLTMTNKDLSYF